MSHRFAGKMFEVVGLEFACVTCDGNLFHLLVLLEIVVVGGVVHVDDHVARILKQTLFAILPLAFVFQTCMVGA